MNEIKTLSSRIVYRNDWIAVREDLIERKDGSSGIYGVVEKPDSAVIAAVESGEIYLVQQYRYPVAARFWELPQGSWGAGAQGTALELAKLELREETGVSALHFQHIARLHEAYDYSTQCFDLFFATGLMHGKQELETGEQGLVCKAFKVADVIDMVCAGDITDAASVAAIGLLRLKGYI